MRYHVVDENDTIIASFLEEDDRQAYIETWEASKGDDCEPYYLLEKYDSDLETKRENIDFSFGILEKCDCPPLSCCGCHRKRFRDRYILLCEKYNMFISPNGDEPRVMAIFGENKSLEDCKEIWERYKIGLE